MRKVEEIIEHVGEGRRNLPQLWTPEPALLAHTWHWVILGKCFIINAIGTCLFIWTPIYNHNSETAFLSSIPAHSPTQKNKHSSAVAAAKSLQSCPTLHDPHRWQPTRLPRPWDSPCKNTGVGCHFLLQFMKVKSEVKSLSRVQLSETPWTAAYQALLSMGFSRQEYWSGT